MPEINGLELLAVIKEYRPLTEVIIVTGHGTMESAIQAMKYGSYDYIQKPFKLDVLKILIEKIDKGEIKDNKYFFETGLSKEQKYLKMLEWWDESLFHLRFAVRSPARYRRCARP